MTSGPNRRERIPSHQITFVEIGVDVDKIGGEIVDVRAANRLGGAKDVLPTGADVGER